jgi:hypothetical protein
LVITSSPDQEIEDDDEATDEQHVEHWRRALRGSSISLGESGGNEEVHENSRIGWLILQQATTC